MENNSSAENIKNDIIALSKEKKFNEAIKYSATNFFNILQAQIARKEVSDKILFKLYKYLSRATTRAIPLDKFAVTTFGNVGDTTNLSFANSNIKYYENLNIEILDFLYDSIIANEANFKLLRFAMNSTVYFEGSYIKFFVFQQDKNELKIIKSDKILVNLINKTTNALAYKDLIKYFSVSYPINPMVEILDYVNSLITSGLLIATIKPSNINNYTLDSFINQIDFEGVLLTDDGILSELQKVDIRGGRGNEIQNLAFLKKNPQFEIKNIQFGRIDTFSDGIQYSLPEDFLIEISRSLKRIDFLRFNTADHTESLINNFILNFKDKYKEGQLIPLVNVLDPESGIELNKGKGVDVFFQHEVDNAIQFNTWYGDILHRCKSGNLDHYSLTDDDLRKFSELNRKASPISSSYSIFGSIIRKNKESVFHLRSCSDFPNDKNFSRFIYFFNENRNELNKIKLDEQYFEGAILAEIYYLPYTKLANLTKRSSNAKYFINLNQVKTGIEGEINISEILLTVENERIKIFSTKYRKEIIPIRTTTDLDLIDFSFYNILNLISDQYRRPPMKWDWGYYSKEKFLPKISYNNIILTERCWNVSRLVIQNKLKKSEIDIETLRKYLIDLHVSSYVLLRLEGDKSILIKTNHDFCLQILLAQLKKDENLTLEDFSEYISSSIDFYNELIIPFWNGEQSLFTPSTPVEIKNDVPKNLSKLRKQEKKWVYIVVKGIDRILESLLLNKLANIVKDLKDKAVIKEFNFLRFGGHNPTLKMRLKLKRMKDISVVTTKLNAVVRPLIHIGDIENFIYDNYIPEYARYGIENINTTDKIFDIDSLFAIDILHNSEFYSYQKRWDITLVAIYQYLQLIVEDIERYKYIRHMRNVLLNELDESNAKITQVQLNNFYRDRRTSITEILSNNHEYVEYLQARKNDLLKLKIENENIMHYIHMFVNRMFPQDQRMIELQLYHCLERYFLFLMKIKHV